MSKWFISCSFIRSHTLCFSYLIFFLPFIIKIGSFLSPLFITTFLLILALLTTINADGNNSEKYSKISFLLTKLGSDIPEEENKDHFQQFEAYKILLETSPLQGWTETEEESNINGFSISEPPPESVDKHFCYESSSCTFCSAASQVVNEISSAEIRHAENESESIHLIAVGEKSLGGFLKNEDDENDFVHVSCVKGSPKEVNTLILSLQLDKIKEEEQNDEEAEFFMRNTESEETAAIFGSIIINTEEGKMENGSTDSFSQEEFRWKKNMENSKNSMRSMRKEKEWRRTLACKPFEERHNSNTEPTEGMDLLWETYEETTTDHHTSKKQQLIKTKTKKFSSKYHNKDHEEEEEKEMDDGKLCCLQALKFSAGKMNLGMGRPNLMKISKAFKGVGWLHHLKKHGKKMYH